MYTIIFITIVLCLIITFYYTIKYFRIKRIINKPIRIGYYDMILHKGEKTDYDYIEFTTRIHLQELDRYTNGTSKIKVIKIEYGVLENKIKHKEIDSFIRYKFSEIQNTSDITWLDTVNDIKQQRKQKIDRINKIRFFNIF